MIPRIAFFTDCFHEVNGVALTSQKFAEYARRQRHPFLLVHAGPATQYQSDGTFHRLALGVSRMRLAVDRDLAFDCLFPRFLAAAKEHLQRFGADRVHVTSPGHVGILGLIAAKQLGLPVAASWHTNIHEFGARRLRQNLSWLPDGTAERAAALAESGILRLVLRYYRCADLLFAPNPELVTLLSTETGRPCFLMPRGVETGQFSPAFRKRQDRAFVIGFAGRLAAEKNVRLLAEIDQRLRQMGMTDHQFLIAGDGPERAWLQAHLPGASLPGVLKGQALADAYANMDVFLFPSETDTYGNVVQEAMASGVPCIVSALGGPKYLIEAGKSGFVAGNVDEYARAAAALHGDPELLAQMRRAARETSEARSWAAVFSDVYARYQEHASTSSRGEQTNRSENVSPAFHQKYNSR